MQCCFVMFRFFYFQSFKRSIYFISIISASLLPVSISAQYCNYLLRNPAHLAKQMRDEGLIQFDKNEFTLL